MKKVLALVLAVVMVVGMASVATFAKEWKPDTDFTATNWGDVKVSAPSGPVYEPGDTFYIEAEMIPGATTKLEDYSITVEMNDSAKKMFAFTKQEDGKLYFTCLGDASTRSNSDNVKTDAEITVKVKMNNNAAVDVYKISGQQVYFADSKFVTKEQFEALKDANEDATVKASIKVGDYITMTDITTPRDVNKTQIKDTPSAIAEALEGKDYAYAGYKYTQPLPGVGTMKVELNSDLLLTGAEKVYVYEVSGDTFKLVASSADDKMFEVEDGAVEFPVSRTSQYIITDKALSSTSSSSGSSGSNNNPGTGANDMVGAAVVMALVAGAGIVAFKKIII